MQVEKGQKRAALFEQVKPMAAQEQQVSEQALEFVAVMPGSMPLGRVAMER